MATARTQFTVNSHDRLSRLGDIAVVDVAGVGVLFAASFFNLVSLDADKDTVTFDGQVFLKLAIVAAGGLYGLWSFASDTRVRRAVGSFPAAWIPIIFVFYMLSSLQSFEPKNAMASSASIICIYLMTIACLVQIGKTVVLDTLFFAAGLFVAGSWMVWLLVPEIGVMEEPVTGGEFTTRMSGLAHPNTLGQFSAMCVLLGSVQYISSRKRGAIRVAFIILALGALSLSLSRASSIALVVALLVGFRSHIGGPNFARRLMVVTGLIVFALMIASTQVNFGQFIEGQMEAFSKSGESEEITSATGRGEIWAKTIELIRQRPAIGYGAASSKYLLEDYSLYTHNMLLNITLCSGIFGGLAGLIMCLSRIRIMFFRRHPMADAIVVFVLVNGLFENIIFSNLCGLPTIVWTIGLVWFNIESDHAKDIG